MLAAHLSDPRLEKFFATSEPLDRGILPVVRLRRKRAQPLLLVLAALLSGVMLFAVLNGKRVKQAAPAVSTSANTSSSSWPAPPPLILPAAEGATEFVRPERINVAAPRLEEPATVKSKNFSPVPSRGVPAVRSLPGPAVVDRPAAFVPEAPNRGAPLLLESGPAVRQPLLPGSAEASQLAAGERVHAGTIASPSQTVAQGSLIPAVLETGFDSAKPGFARAIVSRDVRSFDGKNILIPRGSRLVGESSADFAGGQQSAGIVWMRLLLPDGTTIQLDSPTADPDGGSGVPAKASKHFLSGVGDFVSGAIDKLGDILAARASPFIVLSGSGSSTGSKISTHAKRTPTLKAPPGTSISVFVARDLEFSAPEDGR